QLAGALDRVVDLLGGAAPMAVREFNAKGAAPLAADELAQQALWVGDGATSGGRRCGRAVHHPNRGTRAESAPPLRADFHGICDLRERSMALDRDRKVDHQEVAVPKIGRLNPSGTRLRQVGER